MRFKIVKLVSEYAKQGAGKCVAVYDESRFRWVPLKPLADNFKAPLLQNNEPIQFDILHMLCEYNGIKKNLEKILEEAKDFDFTETFKAEEGMVPFDPLSIRRRYVFEDYEIQKRRKYYEKKKKLRHFLYSRIESIANRIPGSFLPDEQFYFSPNFTYENNLNIHPTGSTLQVPECVNNLDFEGGVGVVVGNPRNKDKPVRNVDIEDAKDYIVGFTVVSHMVNRNIQVRKVEDMNAEIFATSMSPEIATPDEVYPFFQMMKTEMRVNDELVNEGSSIYAVFQPEEVLSFASEGTDLYTGELLSMGCFPVCSGFVNDLDIEMDNTVSYKITTIGEVSTKVGEKDGITHWNRRKPIVHYFKFYRYQIGIAVIICLLYLFRKQTWALLRSIFNKGFRRNGK